MLCTALYARATVEPRSTMKATAAPFSCAYTKNLSFCMQITVRVLPNLVGMRVYFLGSSISHKSGLFIDTYCFEADQHIKAYAREWHS